MGTLLVINGNTSCRRLARCPALEAAAFLAAAAVGYPAHAQVAEAVLHRFTGGSDGAFPTASLRASNDARSGALRSLYGTAGWGGSDGGGNCGSGGCGTIFKLTPPGLSRKLWTPHALWDFTGGIDEDTPIAGLYSGTTMISEKTVLYGTASSLNGFNAGSVFTLVGKTLTTLWSFSFGDGAQPYGGVIADKTGALYLTTPYGGSNFGGTAVQLTPPAEGQTAWTETTIWNFAGGADGFYPFASLIADTNGALYGTTQYGGASGTGTVFKLTPPAQGQTAWTEQILWSFSGGSDGGHPLSALTRGANGALYGTTFDGGATDNGVVFQLIPPSVGQASWTEQVLWSFTGSTDGAAPLFGPLLLDARGALYGTASSGGNARQCVGFGRSGGTVFKLMPPGNGQTAWSESTLWDFAGGDDGCIPDAGLVADNSGTLYGTTQYGGSYNGAACESSGCGVAYALTGTGFAPK